MKNLEEIKKMFNLPEITGVSDKQTKYANDLRDQFIMSSNFDLDLIVKAYESFKKCVLSGRIAAAYAENLADYDTKNAYVAAYETLEGIAGEDEDWDNGIESYFGREFARLVVLMNATDARTIIDLLTGKQCKAYVEALEAIVAKIEAEAKAEAATTGEDNDNTATEETTAEAKKTSYDKSAIMRSAWAKYKAKGNKKTFGECLKAAWAEAKKAAGVETTVTKRTTKTTRRTSKTSTAVYVG